MLGGVSEEQATDAAAQRSEETGNNDKVDAKDAVDETAKEEEDAEDAIGMADAMLDYEQVREGGDNSRPKGVQYCVGISLIRVL